MRIKSSSNSRNSLRFLCCTKSKSQGAPAGQRLGWPAAVWRYPRSNDRGLTMTQSCHGCFACKQPVESSQVNYELLQELSGLGDVCCLGSRLSDVPFRGMSSANTYLVHLKCTPPQYSAGSVTHLHPSKKRQPVMATGTTMPQSCILP